MYVDKIVLVELIEGEVAKLSPRGKGLWEQTEVLVELTPEDKDTLSEQAEIAKHMIDLPLHEQHTLERLMALLAGLYAADQVEDRGELGEPGHDRRAGGRQAPGELALIVASLTYYLPHRAGL